MRRVRYNVAASLDGYIAGPLGAPWPAGAYDTRSHRNAELPERHGEPDLLGWTDRARRLTPGSSSVMCNSLRDKELTT